MRLVNNSQEPSRVKAETATCPCTTLTTTTSFHPLLGSLSSSRCAFRVIERDRGYAICMVSFESINPALTHSLLRGGLDRADEAWRGVLSVGTQWRSDCMMKRSLYDQGLLEFGRVGKLRRADRSGNHMCCIGPSSSCSRG